MDHQLELIQQNGTSDGTGNYLLSLEELPPGIYFLHINTEGQNLSSKKIIKL